MIFDTVFGNLLFEINMYTVTGTFLKLYITDSVIASKHCANVMKQTNFAVA